MKRLSLEVIVLVSVSCSIVTVRCGHCANLLSVNIGALLQPSPLYHQHQGKQWWDPYRSKTETNKTDAKTLFGIKAKAKETMELVKSEKIAIGFSVKRYGFEDAQSTKNVWVCCFPLLNAFCFSIVTADPYGFGGF